MLFASFDLASALVGEQLTNSTAVAMAKVIFVILCYLHSGNYSIISLFCRRSFLFPLLREHLNALWPERPVLCWLTTMQFDAVNPLCLRLGVVNMTHKTETCAPHLSNLNLITRLQRPTFGHLIGGSGYPMSVDLIVLRDMNLLRFTFLLAMILFL